MPDFHYAPIPASVLCDPSLPPLMKIRYGILVGAAFNRTTLKLSLDAIGQLWSEAEGETLNTDSITAYLAKMADAGLISRQRRGRFDWITELLRLYKPHTTTITPTNTNNQQSTELSTAQGLTPTPRRGQTPVTPTPDRGQTSLTPTPASRSLVNKLDVVVDFDNLYNSLEKQQQQLVDVLEEFNISTPKALALATAGVNLRDAILWVTYTKQQKNLRCPTGFVIRKLEGGEPPPIASMLTCPICHTYPCTCGFITYPNRRKE